MAKSEIPEEYKGKPTEYVPFDGFKNASTLVKIGYIITAPSLVIPAIIEGVAYNDAQRNAKAAEAALASETPRPAPAPEPCGCEHGTHFQEALSAPAQSQGRAP